MRFWVVLSLLVLVEGSAFGQAARTVLDGRVVGPDGRPVPGAAVVGTFEWDESQSTFQPERVGADGRFTIRTQNAKDPRAIRVFAYAPGFSNAREVKSSPNRPVTLALRPTIDFTVQITNWQKQPIATATVELDSRTHPLDGVPQKVDARGKLTFKGLNDAESLELRVKAPGYLDVEWQHTDFTKPLEIQLARGAMLRARVLDFDTGAPVAVCKVHAEFASPTTTDPKGNFSAPVPFGRVHVVLDCPGYGRDHDLGMDGLVIEHREAAANRVHTVRARRNRVVRVRVVDADGKPLANAAVLRTFVSDDPNDIAILRHGPPTERETTNDDGEAVFDKSSMDRFRLSVDGAPDREVRFADVRGTIVLAAAAN